MNQRDAETGSASTLEARLASLSPEKRAILERKLVDKQSARAAAGKPAPRRDPALDRIPLSYAQEQLWFIDQMFPGIGVYNECLPIVLPFVADAGILERVLTEIVRRHESLRTTFTFDGQTPAQAIQPPFAVSLPVRDLAADGSAFDEVATAVATEPFDLSTGPLMRPLLVRTRPDESVLLVAMHHIVCDQWSINFLTEEIWALYEAFSQGRPSPLKEPELQYADFAVWQRSTLSGDALESRLAYWRNRLRNAPDFTLPADFPRPQLPTYSGRRVYFGLDRETSEALAVLSRGEHVTMFMTLMAAFLALLQRHAGQDDVVIGTPVLGRDRRELERVFGFFVNFVVLRTDLSGDPSFRELLARVRTTATEGFAHADVPFELVVDDLQPRRDPSRNPLFQVSFQVWAQEAGAAAVAAEDFSSAPDVDAASAKFDLRVDLGETPAGVRGMFEYSADLFLHATMERIAARYATLLRGVVANPDARLSTLPLLGADEERTLLRLAGTAAPYPREATIQSLYEEQAPERTALSHMGRTMTYGELNLRANRLARHLASRGVRPGDFVGVCAERSMDAIAGVLAILKAGGAYVPLDLDYPPERLRFMIEDSGVRLILTSRGATVPCDDVVYLDDDGAWRGESGGNLDLGGSGTDAAYLIYTSGSTGKPKGVAVPHRAVVRLVRNTNYAVLDRDQVLLQFASLSFDASTLELWGALLNGGRIAIAPPGLPSPESLGQILRDEGVTMLWLTASYFNKIVDQKPEALRTVRQIVTGGEVLSAAHLRKAIAALPDSTLISAYGPTENTTFTSTWTVPHDGTIPDSVPIGRPIANTQVFVVDAHDRLAPRGVPGELCTVGDGVALGYHRRPELTAERFIRNPFAAGPEARMYRTGDMVRWLEDGTLEFLGRMDGQVKVRGFRIELGEIEAAVRAEPGVRNVAVVVREDNPDDRRIVAYWVPEGATDDAARTRGADLRRGLQRTLPEYMLPAAFVVLDELPLTPNGKVDRAALPRPGTDRPPLETAYVAPRNEIEARLAAIWAELLGIARVGVHDNFFELGGDSILSIQAVARARQHGIHTTPSQFRLNQTVARLAEVAETTSDFTADQGAVAGDAPLTPVQHWFFDQNLAAPHHYNQSVQFEVPADTDPDVVAETLRILALHHDALRLRFEPAESGWRQFHTDEPGDLLFVSDDDTEVARAQASLDLNQGPVLRGALVSSEHSARLAIAIHHLVVDGVSWRILMEDFAAVYAALAAGQNSELSPRTTSFQRWSKELSEYAVSDGMDAETSYWIREMEHASAEIPADRPGGDNTVALMRHVHCPFDREQTRALLQDLPRAHHVQIEDALLTAVLLSYRCWSGRSDLLIDVEGHGREPILPSLDVSRTVGWFTSIYPVFLRSDGLLSRLDVLRRVKEQLRAVPRRGVGFGILRWLGNPPAREALAAVPSPLVAFNYLGQFGSAETDAGEPAAPVSDNNIAAGNTRAHWLEMNGQVDNGRLGMTWSYSRAIHSPESVERLGALFTEELAGLIDDCRNKKEPGFTPSDFPNAKLQQSDLNKLLARIAASGRKTL